MFNIADKFKKLINLQVTTTKNKIDEYEKLSEIEYNGMKKFINPFPKVILELGCGLGRMSIYLNKKHPGSKYYLADTSMITQLPPGKSRYGWDPKTWYNNLELTKEFCEINDLTSFELIDLSQPVLTSLKDIEFVFSIMSVGFHYPIEQYMEILKQIMKPDGFLIFGIRKNSEHSDIIKKFKYFEYVEILESSKENLLFLKGWND